MEKLKLCCTSRIILAFSALFFLTCCINPDYDLGNLVKHEVNILEDISLPIGDIDMLTLEQVLFKDGELPQSVRKNEAGDLYLDLFSETFQTSFNVPSSASSTSLSSGIRSISRNSSSSGCVSPWERPCAR